MRGHPIRQWCLIAGALALVACGDGKADNDGGPDAVVAPDAGAAPDATPASCDPVTQDGCEAGQKCSVIPGVSGGDDMLGCVADTGSAGLLMACAPPTPTTPDDCAKGLACRGTTDPRCMEFCSSEPTDTCGTGQVCAFGVDLDGDQVTDAEFCTESCDPLAQDCTSSTFACYPSRSGAICAQEGAGGTPALEGETCPFANSCAEGLGCFRIGLSQDWLCFKLCDPVSGTPGCGAGQTCGTVENENWGICVAI